MLQPSHLLVYFSAWGSYYINVMFVSRCQFWLRCLALLTLVVCVYSKMIDLDCALTNPLHCQSVLESNDNSFADLLCTDPLWLPPLALPATSMLPRCQASTLPIAGPEHRMLGPLHQRCPSQQSKRPPPVLLV